MKRYALLSTLLCAALAAGSAPLAAQAVTDQHVQELIRAAAQRVGADAGATLQASTAQPTAPDSRPSLQLTLDDAVKLALDRNLDIAVQRLNPQTYDYSIASLNAFYRPTVTSLVSAVSDARASSNTTSGAAAGDAITTTTSNWNGGLSQQFRWGGNAQVALNNSRQTSDNPTRLYDVQYSPTWSFQYTQPILRNFRIDNTRQQLVVTRLNQDISEVQLQALIINTVSNVRNAYWDLVFAIQSVDVARQSVALADQLVTDNQTRVEVGTMAPIDVVQAQSQAATQRQTLANAEATRRTAELTLKRLIVNGTQDPNWGANVDPVDRPEFAPTPIDVAAAVRRGLENRTDLQQAKKNLQVNDVTYKYLHNQTLPEADLALSYRLGGQAGTVVNYTGSGITRQRVGTTPAGYADALSSLLNNQYPNWNVSLNVSYPIGTSAQDAAVARARVQQNQVAAQLKQIELQIATDITNAATNVQSNVERVQAAQAAREFAQRTLEAEQSKFEVGMSTNYFVVQAQRDLATAQNNELQAVLAYRKSLVELERLQQTSLSSSNITILGR